MGMLLLRYGEIALKGQNRAFFFRKLRRNVRECLRANGLEGDVWQEGQRVYVETADVEAAIPALQRVFGLVSVSPVQAVPAEWKAMSQVAIEVARAAGAGPGSSFRIRARRADKAFPAISPEIERQVGAAVALATGAPVNLTEPGAEIGIEIRSGQALVFGQTFAAPGGMPLASQGRVVALLSSGIDSPVAAWLMMKRGCGVIPVHFASNPVQAEQVERIVEALNRYGYGWTLRPIVLSHQEVMADLLPRLRDLRAERWTCLFCKRALLAKAAEIAESMGAAALVTGDSLGQVASQTLSNLEVISHGIDKPILRPLIGLDKTEIMALARQIGTYEPSTRTSSPCPFLPDRPLTQAGISKLRDLLDRMRSPDSAPGEGTETAQGPSTDREVLG